MEMVLMAAVTLVILGLLTLAGIGFENYRARKHAHR